MANNPPISFPTSYVAPTAVGFSDVDGNIALVGSASPMPVLATRAATPTVLQGAASVGTTVAGPYVPIRGEPIHVQLSGNWTGTVQISRSVDGGTTRQALTIGGQAWARFSANANEVVWQEGEAGATLYLEATLTAGTLNYRVSQ